MVTNNRSAHISMFGQFTTISKPGATPAAVHTVGSGVSQRLSNRTSTLLHRSDIDSTVADQKLEPLFMVLFLHPLLGSTRAATYIIHSHAAF